MVQEMAGKATRAATKDGYADFTRRYRDDPVAFARVCLDLDPLDWQAEVMSAVAGGGRRLSVRSGHGVGKSVYEGLPTVRIGRQRFINSDTLDEFLKARETSVSDASASVEGKNAEPKARGRSV
jgi:hypothetical protein